MKLTHLTSDSLVRGAKLALASLPALAIVLAAAIALGAQPASPTAPKPLVVRDRDQAVIWPAPGAGDFEPVTATLPTVNCPAPGAGDYIADRSVRYPQIYWPALGAGDFEPTK